MSLSSTKDGFACGHKAVHVHEAGTHANVVKASASMIQAWRGGRRCIGKPFPGYRALVIAPEVAVSRSNVPAPASWHLP